MSDWKMISVNLDKEEWKKTKDIAWEQKYQLVPFFLRMIIHNERDRRAKAKNQKRRMEFI